MQGFVGYSWVAEESFENMIFSRTLPMDERKISQLILACSSGLCGSPKKVSENTIFSQTWPMDK